jgi:hypothetical protein
MYFFSSASKASDDRFTRQGSLDVDSSEPFPFPAPAPRRFARKNKDIAGAIVFGRLLFGNRACEGYVAL